MTQAQHGVISLFLVIATHLYPLSTSHPGARHHQPDEKLALADKGPAAVVAEVWRVVKYSRMIYRLLNQR